MPLDPDISLQAGQGAGATNPFDTYGKVLQMQQGMNQIRLFNQEYAARQRLGQIAAQSTDDQGNFNMDLFSSQALRDPVAGPFAGAQLNQMRQAQLGQLQSDAQRTTLMSNAWQGLSKYLATIHDPNLVGPMLRGYVNTQPGFVQQSIAGPASDLARALTLNPDGSMTDARTYMQRRAQLGVIGGLDQTGFNNAIGSPATHEYANPQTGINEQHIGVDLPAGGGFLPAGSSTPLSSLPQGITAEKANELTPTIGGGTGPRATTAPVVTSAEIAPASGPGATNNAAASPQVLKYQESRAGDMAQYQQRVDQQVSDWSNIMRTTQEAQKALQDFKPGGGAQVYAKAAQIAQALGAPESLVNRIGNGDLSASQEFNKLMVDSTMSRIRVALEGIGGSRINQQEFEHFQTNNPNIDTDPNAINKIFKFWQRQYNISRDEQSGMNSYISQHGNLSEWPQKWQDTLQNKYGVGEDDAVAATSGMLNPKTSAAATAPKRYKYIPGQGLIQQ